MSNKNQFERFFKDREDPIEAKVELYNEIGVPFSGQHPSASPSKTGMDRLRSSYIEQQKKLKKKNEL